MKPSPLFVVIGLVLTSCTSERLTTKPWHTSPSGGVVSSTLYPFVPWSVVQQLRPGMSAAEARGLIFELQNYDHPVNAIVYSNRERHGYEVALKLSADGQTIKDISYKKRDWIADGAANGCQPFGSETNRTSSAAGSRR